MLHEADVCMSTHTNENTTLTVPNRRLATSLHAVVPVQGSGESLDSTTSSVPYNMLPANAHIQLTLQQTSVHGG
jgi:hypothetical protein